MLTNTSATVLFILALSLDRSSSQTGNIKES